MAHFNCDGKLLTENNVLYDHGVKIIKEEENYLKCEDMMIEINAGKKYERKIERYAEAEQDQEMWHFQNIKKIKLEDDVEEIRNIEQNDEIKLEHSLPYEQIQAKIYVREDLLIQEETNPNSIKYLDTTHIKEEINVESNADELQECSPALFVKNSDTNDLIKNITANRPNISIHAVENPSEQMIANCIARQYARMPRKHDHFEHYKHITSKELQSRLNNVTVTELPIRCSFSNEITEQSVVYASAQWFYLRYMSYIENPTIETCLMASVASCAAAAAYRNAINSNDNMPLLQRIFKVAAEASFYVCASAYSMARHCYFSNLQTFKDILQLYGLEDSIEELDISNIININQQLK